MDKRLFLAVMLSMAFLFGWGLIAPKLFPDLAKKKVDAVGRVVPDQTTAPTTQPPVAIAATAPAKPAAPVAPAQEPALLGDAPQKQVVIDEEGYRAVFTNRGAQLISFQLEQHDEEKGTPVDLVKKRPAGSSDFPFMIEASDPNWTREINSKNFHVTQRTSGGKRVVSFETRDSGGYVVRKTFETVSPFLLRYRIEVGRPNLSYRVMVGPGIRNVGDTEDTQFITTGNGVVEIGGDAEVIQREKADEFQVIKDQPGYIGIEDNYFLIALKPQQSGGAVIRAVQTGEQQKKRRDLIVGLNAVNGVVSGDAYLGPKDIDTLDQLGLSETVRYGIFAAIARLLLVALEYINQYTQNYGWAIVVLTVFIKILLYPLQHKSIVSMKKMQQVQPKMNAIKEKYRKAKSDPEQRQKMNMEMMKLYQQEGISPLSGCLPLLLQMPILFAFYGLLSQAIELRGAPWILWIQDLSAKDPYYITPILMTATMFIQQLITPTTMDPVQRKVLLAMPIIFGWIFKEFPSGLVLYWLVQNILSIIQQMIMNRYWKDHPESLEKSGK